MVTFGPLERISAIACEGGIEGLAVSLYANEALNYVDLGLYLKGDQRSLMNWVAATLSANNGWTLPHSYGAGYNSGTSFIFTGCGSWETPDGWTGITYYNDSYDGYPITSFPTEITINDGVHVLVLVLEESACYSFDSGSDAVANIRITSVSRSTI